jgi:hypothetical protein
MSKNRGKSKLSKTVLFNANKHVFHCEKSLGTLFYGQPSCIYIYIYKRYTKTCAYSPATLCPNCNAIGEPLSEIYVHKLTNGQLFLYI